MIREQQTKVFVTEDGEVHATLDAAKDHELTCALARWAEATCWTGMARDDVAQAIYEDRHRLAAILKEYVA